MTLVKILLPILIPAVGGDDLRALLEEALDQATSLEIENRPLTEAFDEIVRNTGVQVSIAQDTLDLLPYGRNTRLTARIHNISLREGLLQMTAPLGLTFDVHARGIELVPTPALARIGRRATWDELETLAELHAQGPGKVPADVETLMGQLRFQIDQATDPADEFKSALQSVEAQCSDEALTLACQSLDWTWYPSGDHISIVRRIDQQLRSPVSLRRTSRKLIDVLQALGQQAGVPVRCEAGALETLPPRTRQNFSMYVENQPFGDALQLVSATTGLGYRVNSDSVTFYGAGTRLSGPEARTGIARPLSQPQRLGDPYVGKIALPPGPDGTRVELLIHESDLSPEVNELRRKYLERANQAIKEALLRLQAESRTP